MFKVGENIIVIDHNKAGICSDFQNKILIVREVKDDRLIINSEDVYNPRTTGNFNRGAWVLFQGVRKATPLDKLI